MDLHFSQIRDEKDTYEELSPVKHYTITTI